jgi:hypothetical protein
VLNSSEIVMHAHNGMGNPKITLYVVIRPSDSTVRGKLEGCCQLPYSYVQVHTSQRTVCGLPLAFKHESSLYLITD